ncbi:hypothetical protein ATCC90586_010946 [Pythium insidiosum]|nr:hypothetical protein ATCC90586_010946 [Pythium insidiosum]
MTVLRSDFPGFDSARELSSHTYPGRYLVVQVTVNDAPVYIHNVYSPVDDTEKAEFFDALPFSEFEDNATHLVLGDLNTPLDPRLDSSEPRFINTRGRSACQRWLGCLGVVDPWRIHHPDERVFTGPQPRKNRLDYILLSRDFSNAVYGDSKYFQPRAAGDHLVHQVTLRTMAQPHGRGYWRFPISLLEYPDIVKAIEGEATAVLEKLRSADNKGKVWEEWKRSMKTQLQAVQRKLRYQNEATIRDAQTALDTAAARYRDTRTTAAQAMFQAALATYRECVEQTRNYNQDSAFDFQAANAEKSTKFFFRPIDASLNRVSIEEVRLPDGSLSRNPADISTMFRDHWGSIMGDPTSSGGRPPPPDPNKMALLLDAITQRLDEEEHAILTAPITGAEFAAAIKKMKSTSTPGMDGLTAASNAARC